MTNEKEMLILVDSKDNAIGTATRKECHAGNGKLHRAFGIFLFNSKNQLFIQKRSENKKLWPGHWDISVASHVRPDETYETAAKRRLKEELGVEVSDLKKECAFKYFAKHKDGKGSENEMCAILSCRFDGKINPNTYEISESKFADLDELKESIKGDVEKFTPWLKIALNKFNK